MSKFVGLFTFAIFVWFVTPELSSFTALQSVMVWSWGAALGWSTATIWKHFGAVKTSTRQVRHSSTTRRA